MFGCNIRLQSEQIFGTYIRDIIKEVIGMDVCVDYKIIAVDFDGTLCFSDWPSLGEPNTPLIKYLLKEKASGSKIILWTCRAGQALMDATKWCAGYGLEFDAINDNLPEVVELYGNNSRKITCDIYIDDRSILPDAVGM